MNHPDKYIAKRIDTPNRSKAFTDAVYSGEGDVRTLLATMNAAEHYM